MLQLYAAPQASPALGSCTNLQTPQTRGYQFVLLLELFPTAAQTVNRLEQQ
ncbi:MAG: hypothetical protein F6J87_08270 [Spirulina sp. SIO3F2]|nr:hypothetical protein [Spirulina sp. SIO3F2]